MVNIRNTNISITFAKGRIDDYCVYICDPSSRIPPKDIDYFKFFQNLQTQYPNITIYSDYVSIYDNTDKNFDNNVITHIHQLVDNYSNTLSSQELQELEKYYVVIYMTMIAEEKKANTKLGKRIKRLGMHELLVNNKSPSDSANSSRGKKFPELDSRMKGFGF